MGESCYHTCEMKGPTMDDDLRFREQQHDGRNVAICAGATIAGLVLVSVIGVAPALMIAGAIGGFIVARCWK